MKSEPVNKFRPEWGRANMLVFAAFRYCLGRTTYIVSDCASWLIDYWHEIDKWNKSLIVKEIEEAIEKGCAGDPCDVQCWQSVLDHAKKNPTEKGTCS